MVNHNKNNQSLKTWIATHSLNARNDERAFTIVELLVVIVVIAVLAAITVVGYRGISKQTTETITKGDLSNSYKALENFKTLNDTYPSTIDCSKSESSTNLCIQNNSKDITFTYVPSSDLKTYQLCTTSASLKENYCISNSNNIPIITADADLPSNAEACPSGFILVPGSSTYGTGDFCVAKYEMKIYGYDSGERTYSSSFVPQSRASGTPWIYVSQANAMAEAPTTVDDQGDVISSNTHLITEPEWMTIAQNLLSQGKNWSTGTVGSGFIYTGHTMTNPDGSLAADTDDANSNYGETAYNNASVSANNKRTLVLSNGEVIWDISGNAVEWTQGQTTGGQPGIFGSGYLNRDYATIVSSGTTGSLSVNIFPSGTNISGASSWTHSNGIGKIYSSADETALRVFFRGGSWANDGSDAGVLSLCSDKTSSFSYLASGFRVVTPVE